MATATSNQTTQNQTDAQNASNPQALAALAQLLAQYSSQGGTQAPMNVPQGSSPQVSADAATGIVGGQQGNQGNFAGGNMLPPQAQKSAQKVLSQYYDQHAQALLTHPDGLAALHAAANQGDGSTQQPPMSMMPQQGGQQAPPMSMMPQGGMPQGGTPQQGQQVNPQAMQALQQLLGSKQGQPLGTNQVNNPSILSPQNAFQNTSYNPQTGQIQEGGWANRGLRGLASGGLPGLLQGLLGPGLGAQMGATKEAQVLKAGQPAEIAEPAARAGYVGKLGAQVQQAIEGKTPLQPSDLASITGSINTLNLNSLKDASDKIENDIKNAQDISEFHQKTLNLVGRVGGWFSKSGQTLATGAQESQEYIKKLQTAKAQIDSKISNFKPTNFADQYKYADITPQMAAKELELRRAAGGQ